MKNEKDVKAKVKKLLDKHSWFWWMPPANGYGKVGISDFHALKNGVFLAIETKFGSNKPTAHQRAFLESVNAEHAFAFVVSDSNIEWFEAFLEDFGKETDLVAAEKKMSNDGGARLVDAIRALQALI
jgi:hypothetical protein